MADRSSATSATLRASGPSTPSVDHPSTDGQLGTRPGEGRSPTTLQKLAGLRSDPPMSLPSAMGSMPHASAAAAPPLLPPQVFVRSYGLRVGPNSGLKVRAGAEFGCIRLADENRSGLSKPFDEQ